MITSTSLLSSHQWGRWIRSFSSVRSVLTRQILFDVEGYDLDYPIKLNMLLDVAKVYLFLSLKQLISEGMNYLADCHIIHRDLKAENVLVHDDFVCKGSFFSSNENNVVQWRILGWPSSLTFKRHLILATYAICMS